MKEETYKKAAVKDQMVCIEREMQRIHDDTIHQCIGVKPINTVYISEDLRQRLIANCISFLKKERVKLQKEFDELK